MDQLGPPPGAARRRLVYGLVSLALLMMSVDQTSVSTALSAVQDDLRMSFATGSWLVSGYAVGLIVAFPLAGVLADHFGRKRVFLLAIGLFTIASLACGLAPGFVPLIGFRLVQGLAGGAFIPAGTGIVADHFRRDRDRAIGLFASIVPVGAVIGPIIGGVLVTTTGWRGIFLVNVPLGIVLLVAVAAAVREQPRVPDRRVDGTGIALLVVTLLGGMCAAVLATGPGSPAAVATSAAVGVLAAALLVRHIGRHPDPFLPRALLRGRGFGAMHVVNVLFGGAALGLVALLPHYAQTRFDLGAVVAGGLLALRAVGMMAASTLGVASIRRLGFRPLLLAGFVIHSVGLVMLAVPPAGVSVALWLGIAATVSGVGVGLASPASNNATMHLAPDQVSSISGMRGMFRQAGAVLTVAVVSAVVSASPEPGRAQAISLLVLALVLLVAVPVAMRVPNHQGRW
ncbi:MFS transporter [Pseudonocardia dioxanivorans]|uniref:MFS transporter n=1 Tax=Pseudonocardia dioxanivorans TaxID=240495 RepID=UPI00104BFDF3|nr:MFS transporter [Pseudonocardia dioxanivorans]